MRMMIILKISKCIFLISFLVFSWNLLAFDFQLSATCTKLARKYNRLSKLNKKVSVILQEHNRLKGKTPHSKKSVLERLERLHLRITIEQKRLEKKLSKVELELVKKKCPDPDIFRRFNF